MYIYGSTGVLGKSHIPARQNGNAASFQGRKKLEKPHLFALLPGKQLHLLLFTFSLPRRESVTSTYDPLKSKRYMQIIRVILSRILSCILIWEGGIPPPPPHTGENHTAHDKTLQESSLPTLQPPLLSQDVEDHESWENQFHDWLVCTTQVYKHLASEYRGVW